ncbi:MAG TPA: glycoside hydrolase family 15 protein [Tepidisphaeraceae bacterium]|jgi:GH15 family glucan-1,4-alpha-glucosidase|nr:glycoside hydrolase family 15 protein [Tepidisphaeraceae bacterium]
MALKIEDYAMIGDCQTVALVGKDGSIDWLCFPRFDSGACFASLLGKPDHGRWCISPTSKIRSTKRRYRPGTLILETEFETEDGGLVLVTDFMPPRAGAPDLIRIVECKRGTVRMQLELVIRYDYGSIVPWVRQLDNNRGIRATAGPDTMYLRTTIPLHGQDLTTVAEFDLAAGQSVPFELVWIPTHRPEPPPRDPYAALQSTHDWWTEWSNRCTYDGPWREAVLRSLITLKGLTFAPTGGIVAAPTTSLPECLGGVRNWDYRYCWIRDATFTLLAFNVGGYLDEALAWRQWLINAVAGSPEDMQIMYGVGGERRLTELELPWLPGYENSSPVRVGNAAYRQHQLDTYGEVMDALHQARKLGLPRSEESWRVQTALLRVLERDWEKPDEGIWEIRGPRRHFTHSKVMAWVAMDRAVKAVEDFNRVGDVAHWRSVRDRMHEQIWREGFDPELNSFVQYYGSKDPDASLLMLPLVGFVSAKDPAMRGTVDFIQKRLLRNGFVDRYHTENNVDGLPPGEGSFLLCTFWLADNLALQDRFDEAREIFERLLSLRNDVGLLAEEFDVHANRLVGNFPQAFSHVGLINTARNLSNHGGPAEQRKER